MITMNDIFNFTDKTIIVTGGASGIGREICRFFAGCGANIVIADLFGDKANAVKDELDQIGGKHLAVKVDVTSEEDVDRLVGLVTSTYDSLDIVFNNAGICVNVASEKIAFSEWKKVIDINLNAVFLVAQKCGQVMIQQKSGCIINTASMSGHVVNQPQAQSAYNASKAGVIMLTKSLAVEWVEHNVRVNSISPGYIGTEMTKSAPQEWTDSWIEQSVTKRLGEAVELMPALAFLAADNNGFTTGTDLVVDGGFSCV